MKTKWGELIERFQNLAKTTSTEKTTSYSVKIWVDFWDGWDIDMGTYDISNWPRHTLLGPFKSEEEALEAFEKKIKEAEEAILTEGNQDEDSGL